MDWFYIVPTVSAILGTFFLFFYYTKANKQECKKILYVDFLRIFFGVHLIFSGLRFYIGDAQPPMPHPIAGPFMTSLNDMGIFPGIKAMEVVLGIGLLVKRFVPLILIMEVPTTATIFYMNVFITGGVRQWISGPLELIVHGLLLLAYFNYYRSVLTHKSAPIPLWELNIKEMK